MAFENFPETEKTTTTDVTSTAKKNNLRTILTGVLVVALLGTWGYIIWDKNNTKDTLAQKETVIASTSTQRDELQKELAEATMLYDNLKTSNSKKDSAITAQDRDIAEKRERIQALLNKVNATQQELSTARIMIASLNGDIASYQAQVEVLQGQNVALTEEKRAIVADRDRITRNLDSTTTVLKSRNDIIDVGSTLHASNFSISGIKEKNSGKEKSTSTAKRVDKLRISFDLNENMIAQPGTKEIFVVITAPDGSPVAVEALGSGKFNTREGQEKIYTQKLDVNYIQNKKQTVSFDWKQNKDFNTGNYKIEVYNNGFKVGEASKPLKKGGIFS
jgi:nitrate reductase NapE component